MLFFIFLLEAVLETKEPTVMARQSGAPYVFYKQDGETSPPGDETETAASIDADHLSQVDETPSTLDSQTN